MARLNYVELPTSDIAAARRFYEQAFGWTLADFGPSYAATATGDTDIGRPLAKHWRIPVFNSIGEALVLGKDKLAVDGVLIVGRPHVTTRDAAAHLRQQMLRLHAPLLGVVANGVKAKEAYGYGYGRAYGDRQVKAV